MSEFVDVAPIKYGKCQTLGTTRGGVRNRNKESENHLNGGFDCISSFVPHSNWGSKSTKFDDLLRERRSKSMLLKTLQDIDRSRFDMVYALLVPGRVNISIS